MPEPITAVVASRALDLAAEQIKKIVRDAQAKQATEVARALGYLRAGREAVWALEQESQAILSDASRCDLASKEAVDGVLLRLERFLHEDRIRPELIIALQGLRDTHEALQRRSATILQWPWRKNEKEAAIADFTEVLGELITYLDQLSEDRWKEMIAGTGPQAMELTRIRGKLREASEGLDAGDLSSLPAIRLQIDTVVSHARLDPKQGGWLELTQQIEALSNRLRNAFGDPVMQAPKT